MMSFRGGKLAELPMTAGSIWLLTDIAEHKGRERLYTRQASIRFVMGMGDYHGC